MARSAAARTGVSTLIFMAGRDERDRGGAVIEGGERAVMFVAEDNQVDGPIGERLTGQSGVGDHRRMLQQAAQAVAGG